jgi:hypothetical protein
VVSFTPQLLYTLENGPRYPFDRRLGGPQSRSGPSGEDKNLLPCRESNPGRPAHSPSLRRGADKSLAFPICNTTKRIFLGWGKEVRTTS